jgi:hypothetical protein
MVEESTRVTFFVDPTKLVIAADTRGNVELDLHRARLSVRRTWERRAFARSALSCRSNVDHGTG